MLSHQAKFTDTLRGYLGKVHASEGLDDLEDEDRSILELSTTQANGDVEDWEAIVADIKETLAKQEDWAQDGANQYLLESEFGGNVPFQNPFRSLQAVAELPRDSDVETVAYEEPQVAPPLPKRSEPSPSPVVASEKRFDRSWLLEQCEIHLTQEPGALTAAELGTDVFAILRSNRGDDDIQSALVDLLGYSNLGFLHELLGHRRKIVETITEQAQYESPPAPDRIESAPAYQPRAPVYGAQVTVMSETEKVQMKQQRREAKKRNKLTREEDDLLASASILGFEGQHLRKVREEQLRNGPETTDNGFDLVRAPEEELPNVYRSGSGGSTLSMFGTRFALPVGTERGDYKDYEELTIPIAQPAPVRSTERRVPISDLDPWAQRGFKGYTALNRVQSIVYPIAFGTNENMLVCAPTGAGKTDIAMLTILRTLAQFREDGYLRKNDFKIIYVAPMKALAAEIVRKFSSRLGKREEEGGLGIAVRELTGDMQLTKAEIAATQVIVTTPEKWDVVTRKSVGDTELAQKVRLLIIDEVHLLHEDRGSVIESIVARTLRQVESSQSMIRIVGLSATLPNFGDVAAFLGVNKQQGLFYFDSSFRPVPLEQHFIGVKGKAGSQLVRKKMDEICYDNVADLVRNGAQVMVFVHSRKDTVKTAMMLRDEALNENSLGIFDTTENPQYGLVLKEVQKSRNKELRELFATGFGIHHAGMLRSDRSLTERLFEKGLIKVLCCTATLAWGVNLPAYAVIIKGTQVYDAKKGGFIDLSILDVLQIFGRAGRPQYEDRGVGYILTSHDKLTHYVSSMTQQHPIESQFANNLTDNLNAEISLGTVTNMDEAVRWLSYTYLYARMMKNPFQYGLNWAEVQEDPTLGKRRRDLINNAAKTLAKTQMINYDERNGYLTPKDLGRTASSFYIQTASIEIFNSMMRPRMTEADVLSMLSMSTEFDNIKVREEEVQELKGMEEGCMCAVKGGIDTNYGKTNILLQSYISRTHVEDFALVSDVGYVAQNASRILRALFEIALGRNWGPTASTILSLCKAVDKRMWSFEHPLSQFDLPVEIMRKLENAPKQLTIEDIREMDGREVGQLVRHQKMGRTVVKCAEHFPSLILDASIAPITRTVLRVTLTITPDFVWNDRVHGMVEPWWIWVEDHENTEILYSEYFLLHKRQQDESQKIGFTIPIPTTSSTVDQLPPQIFIRAVSDRWIGADVIIPVSFKHLILPSLNRSPVTELLALQPLPISALQDPVLEDICASRFQYFNPVQTQIFHTLYRSEHNVLVGAPTGSGKTVAAELAMWAAFRERPNSKVVYIAPLKALVRERVSDWRARLTGPMNRSLVELTGDVTPDLRTIQSADIIITTPEKWDGISRSWQTRKYVTDVSLVIIDEIHLLGGDRGPILEVIVSRMNYISSRTQKNIRIVGLSTALANANDLADWLGIKDVGLFNFRHSVRPVPLEIYIDGFAGKHYCPRMMSMNKPTYAAIMTHSPTKPVIVFVSSRRQTRLTAQDLISLCGLDENPKRFLHMAEEDLEILASQVKDQSLKLSLGFGIGLHHAGLIESDRKLSEELFVNGKIQILIATSTLAWGVNYPAHLVVIKGTEFYDAKVKGYVDFQITDVLQMMGRAGRPQFDDSGVARILVHDVKKNFYKKFLHEPFPVESSLHTCLHDHVCAEIVGGAITSKQDAMDHLTWTYLYRRLKMNPTFYGVEDPTPGGVNVYMSKLVEDTIRDLEESTCVQVDGEFSLAPTTYGRIASYYYLHFTSMKVLNQRLGPNFKAPTLGSRPSDGDFPELLRILCQVAEYDELPVRHNEDKMNIELEKLVPIPINYTEDASQSSFTRSDGPIVEYDDPHAKAFLLLQAHLTRLRNMPCADYFTDMVSVLDQSIRVMQAMVDVAAEHGFLSTCLGIMNMMQCIKQATWPTTSSILTLPRTSPEPVNNLKFNGSPVRTLAQFTRMSSTEVDGVFSAAGFSRNDREEIKRVVSNLPSIEVKCRVLNAVEKVPGLWGVDAGQEYEIRVEIVRKRPFGDAPSGDRQLRVYSPKFPKPQYEGWWIVLGDAAEDDVLALKRQAASADGARGAKQQRMTTGLRFIAPDDVGEVQLSLFVVSDAYVGLDDVTKIRLLVK
ncbi:Sec63 Brl domain-containing protein [Fimicolochytrium jonesii]|uniref:Sec63 Brl domain-containing protein n=1 Tax=Fimicolochytrium jonesii TaxID=1396493 RepID=UPI0022FF3305|nr:Sec63 Brl domain-containing protein [Fimicolochytrium jonesii]KAI8820753.1 Sec63 Brl domain-containing protein [Fimicolochytrium jonesii]